MSSYNIYHSAKGTSWAKKDHKYIKKANGKYYYKQSKRESIFYKGGNKVGKLLDNAITLLRKRRKTNKSVKDSSIKSYSDTIIKTGTKICNSVLEKVKNFEIGPKEKLAASIILALVLI